MENCKFTGALVKSCAGKCGESVKAEVNEWEDFDDLADIIEEACEEEGWEEGLCQACHLNHVQEQLGDQEERMEREEIA